jgi:hypothetical protein
VPDCPLCAEPVEAGAEKCRSCGESLVRRTGAGSSATPGARLGVVLGLLGLCVVLGLVAVAIPSLIPTSMTPRNEAFTIGSLKTINTAQTLFREGDKDADGTLDYGALAELSDAGLIDAVLGGGQKNGYVFQVAASPTTPEFLWMAVASPAAPGTSTGVRHFVTNQAGVIYYSTTTPFAITPDCAIPAGAVPVGK